MTDTEPLRLLAASIAGDVDALTAALVPLLVASEPPDFYDEERLADLHVAAHEGLAAMLGLLAGTGGATALSFARTTGRRQVQQDLPLEGVLSAYRQAGQVVWKALVAHVRTTSPDTTEELLDAATGVWEVVDLFCTEAAQGFREEERQLRDRDEQIRAAVLGALLEGRGADPRFARDARQALGLPAQTELLCVVGLPAALGELALDNARERLKVTGFPSAWSTANGAEIGIVSLGKGKPAKLRQTLTEAARSRVGISQPFTDLAQLPQARALAETAARLPGPSGLRTLEDDLLAALVVEAPLVAELIRQRTVAKLVAVAGADEEPLLATMRAYLEAEGSLGIASAKLFVHRNTLQYRLQKIERVTGVPLRSLSDQMLWAIGLKAHDSRL